MVLDVSIGAVAKRAGCFDGLGRLKRVTEPGMDLHYVLDALGRRIGKVRDGNLEKGWLYADALNPIAELDGAGNVRATFIYGSRAHVPDAMVMTDGTVYRFITDHVGSVRLVVNAETGEVVQRMDYDAFGRVLNDTNPGFQPFGFAGGLYDDDTGLVRFGARDYDAYAGRWTAKDPILFRGEDTSLYGYVGNEPINWMDPSGLYSFSIGFSASLGALGFGGSISLSGTYVFGSEGITESAFNVTTAIGASGTIWQGNIGFYGQITTAESLNDLEGYGEYIGRAGFGPAYGGYVQAPGCYQGFEISAGAGFGFQAAASGVSDTEFYGGGPWQ